MKNQLPYCKTSEAIKGYDNSSIAKSETNDCVVRAIASAFDLEYDKAHKFVGDKFGRKPRQGTFGFIGATLVVFIATKTDLAVLLGYITYYFFMGKIVNRPKYVTDLGKMIVFPIPSALGAFTGYKLTYVLLELIK